MALNTIHMLMTLHFFISSAPTPLNSGRMTPSESSTISIGYLLGNAHFKVQKQTLVIHPSYFFFNLLQLSEQQLQSSRCSANPLGSVHPQLPLDASTCHFHPRKNRQVLPNGSDSPSSPCTVAPGQPPGLWLPCQRRSPTEENLRHGFQKLSLPIQLLLLTGSPSSSPSCRGSTDPCRVRLSTRGTKCSADKHPGGGRRPVPTAAFILEVRCG